MTSGSLSQRIQEVDSQRWQSTSSKSPHHHQPPGGALSDRGGGRSPGAGWVLGCVACRHHWEWFWLLSAAPGRDHHTKICGGTLPKSTGRPADEPPAAHVEHPGDCGQGAVESGSPAERHGSDGPSDWLLPSEDLWPPWQPAAGQSFHPEFIGVIELGPAHVFQVAAVYL